MEWYRKRRVPSPDYSKVPWHKWFAWFPVVAGAIKEGEKERIVWLSYCERKGNCYAGHFGITTDGNKLVWEWKPGKWEWWYR